MIDCHWRCASKASTERSSVAHRENGRRDRPDWDRRSIAPALWPCDRRPDEGASLQGRGGPGVFLCATGPQRRNCPTRSPKPHNAPIVSAGLWGAEPRRPALRLSSALSLRRSLSLVPAFLFVFAALLPLSALLPSLAVSHPTRPPSVSLLWPSRFPPLRHQLRPLLRTFSFFPFPSSTPSASFFVFICCCCYPAPVFPPSFSWQPLD